MTIQEMHYRVDQGLQKVASFVYSNFEPAEIDGFINQMILRFIKDRYVPQQDGSEEFQLDTKRLDDLQAIIEDWDTTISGSTEGSNAQIFLGAITDYLLYVSTTATLGYDECKRVLDETKDFIAPVRVIKQEFITRALRDPYRKSTPENGSAASLSNNNLVLYGGKRFIYKGVSISYIRKPAKVDLALSVDCDLAEHTHDEIVDLTVQHILEVIESPRYQSNSAQVQKTE